MEVQFSNQTRSLAVIRSRRQGEDHDRDHVVHVLCTVGQQRPVPVLRMDVVAGRLIEDFWQIIHVLACKPEVLHGHI